MATQGTKQAGPPRFVYGYTIYMYGPKSLVSKFYRLRSRYWRDNRKLFPSPAEIALIRLMGGTVFTLPALKSTKTGFPLALVLSMGVDFRIENVRREVRVGKYWVDFGNDLNRGIEVDGKAYHHDIVMQQQRDEYFQNAGWGVLHIKPTDIYNQPKKTREKVLNFLTQ